MATWNSFDHPFSIQWVARVKQTTNQTTGEVTAPTETITSIVGNFESDALAEEERRPGALVQEGDAALYTASLLKLGDGVRVHQDTSGTNYIAYRVKGEEQGYAWIHKKDGTPQRRCFILKREETE